MRWATVAWAVALIALGVFLLLRDLLPSWGQVSVGSLVLIGVGAWLLWERPYRGGWLAGWLAPVVLIALGAVLLLRDVGVLPPGLSLWPVVLIAAGVAVLLAAASEARAPAATAESIPLDGATQARVAMRHGAGRLLVGPMDRPGVLLEGTFSGGVEPAVRRDGPRLEVSLRQGWARPPGWWWGRGLDWAVSLTREVPLSLDLRTGASSARLELEALRVTDLSLEVGASEVELTLPARGTVAARVRAGAARLRVRVPAGVAARIRTRGGLASLHVDPARFPRVGEEHRSPGFEGAPDRVDLEVAAGAADVRVS